MKTMRERIAKELYAQECQSWGVSTVEGYASPEQRSAYERRADRILALLDESEPNPNAECAKCGAAACRGVQLLHICRHCIAFRTPTQATESDPWNEPGVAITRSAPEGGER